MRNRSWRRWNILHGMGAAGAYCTVSKSHPEPECPPRTGVRVVRYSAHLHPCKGCWTGAWGRDTLRRTRIGTTAGYFLAIQNWNGGWNSFKISVLMTAVRYKSLGAEWNSIGHISGNHRALLPGASSSMTTRDGPVRLVPQWWWGKTPRLQPSRKSLSTSMWSKILRIGPCSRL